LLRAEASFRLGQRRYAIADVTEAIAIAPDDLWANRKMLAWAKGSVQQATARRMLSTERDLQMIKLALNVLGENAAPAASMRVYDDAIEGWAVWNHGGSLEVSISSLESDVTYYLEGDPSHPLADARRQAASFRLVRPRSDRPQSFTISVHGNRIFGLRVAGNERAREHTQAEIGSPQSAGPTVIVPVYADYPATRACLDSLLAAVKGSPTSRILLVDDATPDKAINRYLADLQGHPLIEILTNRENAGFVGSVNRALSQIKGGDVVLLNSDTVVPIGFVERLAEAARSASDIGTVTPLSNNGEFSSFPIPNQANDSLSAEDTSHIDRTAEAANRGVVVGIPSGVGFCLYITRACLQAVGGLSERYQRGYLEDADFCLRARENGFRNVCAPSVYVHHEGSRSFQADKRSLVLRNLEVLDAKFPSYRSECAAFLATDPLRHFRERIERRLPLPDDRPRLIVSGGGELATLARHRGRALTSQGAAALRLEISCGAEGVVASLLGVDGAAPQNIRFRIDEADELRSIAKYLQDLKPSSIEILDPGSIPFGLLDLLTDHPYELFVADAGLISPDSCSPTELLPPARSGNVRPLMERLDQKNRQTWRRRWRGVAASAKTIMAPSPIAYGFAKHYLPDLRIVKLEKEVAPELRKRRASGRAARLAIVPLRRTADEFARIDAIVRSIRKIRSDASIIVLGETIDDKTLTRGGNCFVTGRVEAQGLRRLLRQYQIQHVMVGAGSPLFGHPIEASAIKSRLPLARLDWSFGAYAGRDGDLLIKPNLKPPQIAETLVQWMEAP
jgi:GT2 family glycosyltransferase